MILIPIGHDEGTTRRLPWVTFGIVGLCFLAFLLTGFGGSRSEWEIVDSYQRVMDYWLAHPYLQLNPEIERSVFAVSSPDMREAFEESARTQVEKPAPEIVAAEQAELYRLCDAATSDSPEHPFYRWGLVPSRIGPVTLVTHMFLHAGWLHLLGNLFLLFLCAPFVEDVWSRPVFGAFYAVAGIVAALSFAVPHSDLAEPLVGASGAIAGVMGAFAVRFARSRVRFFYAFGLSLRGTFRAPAWAMLALWLVQQVFLAMMDSGSGAGDKVAYLAHAGGFAFGAVAALGMKHFRVEERWLAGAIEAKANQVILKNEAVDRALAATASGNSSGAWDLLTAELRKTPSNVEAALALWCIAQDLKREKEAASAFGRAIEHEVRTGNLDAALGHWDELRSAVPTATLEVRAMLRIAADYVRRGDRKEAADALRRALLLAVRAPDAAILLRIAEAASGIDPAIARAAAATALGRPELNEGGRARARALSAL